MKDNDSKPRRVLSVDANSDGGSWSWNQWWTVGTYEPEILDWPPRKLLAWFRSEGYLSDASKGRCAIEDDQYNIVVVDKNTRQPLFALEYGNHDN